MSKRKKRSGRYDRPAESDSQARTPRADDGPAPSSPEAAPSTTPADSTTGPLHPIVSVLLAALSGTLWFLACASFDIWPLAWVAMVPLFFVTERAKSGRSAFLYGWLGGTVANTGGFYWITGLLTRFAHMSWPLGAFLCLLLCAYQALVFALALRTARVVRRHSKLPMAFVAPLSMVAFEYLLPMLFPFHVGITQAWQIHVIQIADVTGPLGVSALLLMANGAVYDLLTERRARVRSSLVALGVLAAALTYGHVRIAQFDRLRAGARQLRVGLVQPNVGFDEKAIDHPENASSQLTELHEVSRDLERRGAELIVWPETAYPYTIPRSMTRDLPADSPDRLRGGFSTPLVAGAVTRDFRRRPPGERMPLPFNSAILVDRDGAFTGRFDKMFLLLFGEYTPGRETFRFIDRLLPDTAGQFAHGREVITLPFTTSDGRTWQLGPLICYEDILESFGRALGRQRPHLLVNITNDAWFGATSEPWEHLALSVYRAVEQRVDLVRAVNTGVSAFVDANGRVYQRSYSVDPGRTPRGPDSLLGTVALREAGHTFFARFGNVFAVICSIATMYLWLIAPRRKRAVGAGSPLRDTSGDRPK